MRGKKTGGRKKGTPNKATADVKALAQDYAEAAIRELARLAQQARSEPARVAAIHELLDRAYGKPAQQIDHTGSIALVDELRGARERAGITEIVTAH